MQRAHSKLIAELAQGGASNDMAHRDDLFQMVQIGGALGIGESTDDPAMKEWIQVRLERAETLLRQDDADAWNRVGAALLQAGKLSGDEVRGLVAEELEG